MIDRAVLVAEPDSDGPQECISDIFHMFLCSQVKLGGELLPAAMGSGGWRGQEGVASGGADVSRQSVRLDVTGMSGMKFTVR